MAPFFITGLPRSRTAWLSVVAGCVHEPGYGDMESARRIWSRPVGIADAGLGMHLPAILREFQPRTLIVERPQLEVMDSLRSYFGAHIDPGWAPVVWDKLRDLFVALRVESPQIKRVAFADLDSIDVVRDALAWLGVPEPRNLEGLMHMNIQSSLHHNLAKLRAFQEREAA